ncbi:hypothetical protein [Kutzneria kofuensis]|uniref:hypothetical protein n=1 Tax=Kutzneria kofuensis TaxID=103725 RepID=UPI0031EC8FDC
MNRLGQRRNAHGRVESAASSVALVMIGLSDRLGVPLLVAGLLLFGFFSSSWDVAMNIQGTVVERRLGRSIMPRFHAATASAPWRARCWARPWCSWSAVAVHLTLVAIAMAAVLPYAVGGFLPDELPSTSDNPRPHRTLRYWLEPRTLMIGVFVCCARGFSEGAGNDWTGVTASSTATTPRPRSARVAYATFLARDDGHPWFGPRLLGHLRRVIVLRIQGGIAVTGLLLFIFAPAVPLAFVGAALWGVGVAFGYPVGMSAAADDPAHAAGRVTVASRSRRSPASRAAAARPAG